MYYFFSFHFLLSSEDFVFGFVACEFEGVFDAFDVGLGRFVDVEGDVFHEHGEMDAGADFVLGVLRVGEAYFFAVVRDGACGFGGVVASVVGGGFVFVPVVECGVEASEGGCFGYRDGEELAEKTGHGFFLDVAVEVDRGFGGAGGDLSECVAGEGAGFFAEVGVEFAEGLFDDVGDDGCEGARGVVFGFVAFAVECGEEVGESGEEGFGLELGADAGEERVEGVEVVLVFGALGVGGHVDGESDGGCGGVEAGVVEPEVADADGVGADAEAVEVFAFGSRHVLHGAGDEDLFVFVVVVTCGRAVEDGAGGPCDELFGEVFDCFVAGIFGADLAAGGFIEEVRAGAEEDVAGTDGGLADAFDEDVERGGGEGED